MTPIAIALAAWLLGSVPVALLIGGSIRQADAAAAAPFLVPDRIPDEVLASVDLTSRR